MPRDSELLLRYVAGDQSAFAELIRLHVNLVYSAAARRVADDRGTAEEITQTVFAQCARKAAELQHHPALGAWLHRATRYAAIDALRAKRRRELATERFLMNPEFSPSNCPTPGWTDLRPMVDGWLDRLPTRDREAITLRFFEGQTFVEVGRRLHLTEDAARMRVDRALGRLRDAMAHRGIRSTAAAVGGLLVENAGLAAPAGMAESVGTHIALHAGASATASGVFLFMNKVQISVAAAILVVGTAGIVAESRENQRLQREFDTALTEAAAPSLRPGADVPPAHDTQSTAELARLHDRIAELRARPDGVVDAEIVPPTEWRNRGWATPEAAFETLYWAITRHQFDVLGRSYIFGDKAKAQADAAFASLPADLQARYGTPERLFAPFVFGGGEGGRIDATQVIDVNPGDQDNEANLRFWLHFKDGSSRVETLPFQRVGDKWLMGSHAMGFVLPALTPEFVQKISAPGAAPDAATSTP